MKRELRTIEEQCQGNCPHCNSDDLDYQGIEVDGDYCWYPFTCNVCKAVGSEDYIIKYNTTEVDVELEVDGDNIRCDLGELCEYCKMEFGR
jgi:hypothetical protein|tara:strand:+ start:446 stop:718 length:273 start_codon:yes stop_codon:yes gene_type:complete